MQGNTKGKTSSSGTKNNQKNRQVLESMKQEIASEAGINLKQGYNGELTSREAGRIGGGITKRVIEQMESSMSGGK
jgi:hypothetical protein